MTRWLFRWWVLVPLVLVLDVVTLFAQPFSPALRGFTVAVLTTIALAAAALGVIERIQRREQQRAAYESLARARATPGFPAQPPGEPANR